MASISNPFPPGIPDSASIPFSSLSEPQVILFSLVDADSHNTISHISTGQTLDGCRNSTFTLLITDWPPFYRHLPFGIPTTTETTTRSSDSTLKDTVHCYFQLFTSLQTNMIFHGTKQINSHDTLRDFIFTLLWYTLLDLIYLCSFALLGRQTLSNLFLKWK